VAVISDWKPAKRRRAAREWLMGVVQAKAGRQFAHAS